MIVHDSFLTHWVCFQKSSFASSGNKILLLFSKIFVIGFFYPCTIDLQVPIQCSSLFEVFEFRLEEIILIFKVK